MILTDRQRAFLDEVHFAVVATIASDGMPHQIVMWYQLKGNVTGTYNGKRVLGISYV